MSDYIQELAIAIGLDADGLQKGLEQAQTSITEAMQSAKHELEQVEVTAVSASNTSAATLKKLDEKVEEVGNSATETAKEIKTSFGGLGPVFEMLKSKIAAITGVLGLMAGGAETFTNYIEQSDALGTLSTQLGISEQELDAWAKANEVAGGSAEALFESLKTYYDQTGRPAEEFFKLGEKIEGMTRRQAQAYLQAQGVAWDAIPVFLEGQKAADELVAKYRKTAFTSQDAKNARAFKVAWMDFKVAAQDVGNGLVRLVLPAIKGVIEMLTSFVTLVRENARAIMIFGAGLMLAFAPRAVGQIKAAVSAVKAFAVASKVALLPIAAVAAGVATLALVIDDLIGFGEGADSMLERVMRSLGMTSEDIESVRSAVSGAIDAFSSLWESVKPFAGDVLKGVFKGLAFVIGAVATVVTGLIAVVVGLGIGMTKTAKDMGRAIGQTVDDIANSLSEIKATVSDALSHSWDSVVAWFESWPTKIDEKIIDPLSHAFDTFPSAMSAALESAWSSVVDWFSGWSSLIMDYVTKPLKDTFSGIGKFFGFGDESDKTGGELSKTRAAQQVLATHGLSGQGDSYTTTATLNMPMTINGASNPQETARQVQGVTRSGFGKTAGMVAQAVRGTNLK